MEPTAILPIRSNLILAASFLLLQLGILCLLPLLAAGNPYWLLLIPAAALATPACWALIHEGIHGLLLPGRDANNRLARLLSIFFGAAFHVLAFGHLMHHRYNRQWESEWYDAAGGSRSRAALTHYGSLLGGLYLSEVALSALMAVLPESIIRRIMQRHLTGHASHPKPELPVLAEQYFLRRGRLQEVRRDMLAAAALYGLSFYLYGPLWPWLLGFIALRGLLVSLADNSYHYATPLDNSVPAKELYLPTLLSKAMLHFNLHHSHHLDTRQPWTALPALHARVTRRYHESYPLAILRQFRGPLPFVAAQPAIKREPSYIPPSSQVITAGAA